MTRTVTRWPVTGAPLTTTSATGFGPCRRPAVGEVLVLPLCLDLGAAELGPLREVLSPDERARAERFAFDELRRRFVACRGQLRVALGGMLEVDPAALRFVTGEHGKPALAGGVDLAFNVSHSGSHGLLAVGREELGVDVERVGGCPTASLLDSVCAPAELDALAAVPAGRRAAAFIRLWVAKEAVLKASGQGLSVRPAALTVPAERPAAVWLAARRYWLAELPAPAGYAAALACSAPPSAVELSWPPH